MKSLMI